MPGAMDTFEVKRWFDSYVGDFAALGRDDGDVARLEVTHVITDGPAGRRISSIIVHTAPPGD